MKRILTLTLVLLLLLSGCRPVRNDPAPPSLAPPEVMPLPAASPAPLPAENPSTPLPEEMPTVRLAALKGPTTMGLVRLLEDAEQGRTQNDYTATIGTIDETTPLIAKGEVDIAAVPANLASVFYNNTSGAYRVIAINTLGVLYLVEKGETIGSVNDLKGKTVYSVGKGAVPEFSVNYVLTANDIDPEKDLTIEFKSEPAEIIPLLLQSENGIAVLQQPFVTTALEKVQGLRVALDWTQEWDKVSADGSALVTGVMIVRTEFLDQNPEIVKVFLREYAESVAYTNEHPEEAGVLVEKYGIATADIAARAIPACNLVCIEGEEMRESLSGYLKALYEQNPQSVGGTLPPDDFYYVG